MIVPGFGRNSLYGSSAFILHSIACPVCFNFFLLTFDPAAIVDLFFHKIEARDLLRYRMFDLDSGVHFHEIEILVFVNKEFDSPCAFVFHALCPFTAAAPIFSRSSASTTGKEIPRSIFGVAAE